MFHQSLGRSLTLLAVVVGLSLYAILGGFFAREIVIEIAILAILAISLDLVAGFGGMVSLFHGAIMGVSAYGYGVLTANYGLPPAPAALAGIGLAVLFGGVVAAITSNTTGIFFIMATLAFGQLAYTLIFRSRWLGGDDGMGGIPRFDLGWTGIDTGDSMQFALFAVALIAICYIAAALLLRSGFGRTLCGIHSNPGRMRALGVATWRIKTGAFAISSLLAGVAGVVAAQHTQYISPELLVWTYSGEVLIVVILGGLGTLIGPVVGAVVFVLLKHELSNYTDYWHMVVGLVLIATVLAGGRGLFGQVEHWWRQRRRPAPPPPPTPATTESRHA